MGKDGPKWSRRKEERPSEIINAAIEVFAEKGFAATKLDDVAQRAGVVKGTLYRYYDTKEGMFRAVVDHALASRLHDLERVASGFEGSLVKFVPLLLRSAAARFGDERFPSIARMVLTESRLFPDLAAIWHDRLITRILGLVADMISKAQAQGEARAGDPQLYAFSILGPMVIGVLFHEIFGSALSTSPDLEKLADQHTEFTLRGILVSLPDR